MSTEQAITKISGVLKMIIESSGDVSSNEASHFDSKNLPPISIEDYIVRFITYSKSPNEVYICTYIVMKRFCTDNNITLTLKNVHRIFAIAFVCCVKFILDDIFSMRWYAYIAGISIEEINKLEQIFLIDIDWNLNINSDEYMHVIEYLLSL